MTRNSVFTASVLGILFAFSFGGDCASDVSYSERRHYVEPPPPPRVREEVRVYPDAPPPPREKVRVYHDAPPPRYDEPGYRDRGPRLPNGIPNGAELVKDEQGKIRWTADASGTFYLYDVNKDFVRYSGPVRRGQEVIVMPGDDIIYVDQKAVSHENLQHDNTHRIYFLPGVRDNVTNPDRGYGEKKGGAGDPGRTIPKGSDRLASGRGDLVINAAKSRGTVYIYDEDSRNVIYTADLDRGNSLKLDVSKGILYVNSKKYASVKVPRGHTLSLYMSGH